MRYGVFALMLVVGFMTGFLIPVVSDVLVNGWRVTPRLVADRAEMTGQAVAQITQPATLGPDFKERRDATPEPRPKKEITKDEGDRRRRC